MHDRVRQGLDAGAITALIEAHFPQVHEGSGRLEILSAGDRKATVRMLADERMMRPGGTVSGPAMFKLADFSVYVAILAVLGESALQAVTTSMTMNFLTRPKPGDLVGEARLLKLGRRLAVAEVAIHSAAETELVAHATSTYVLPSARAG
jgi:uncharacterized protein (TIGR00369 family)